MMSDQFLSCVPTAIRVEQMRLIKNLIEVKISDEQLSKGNFTDGIKIQVKSSKPFIVNSFWLVKIRDIHTEIEKDWQTMRNELWDNKFLADKNMSLYQNKPEIYQESNATIECNIKPPQPIDTSKLVTTTPRDFYPLVIIVICYEEEASPQATDAAANIHIVHIKDDQVRVKSHVIKQYIKQIDGRILDISPLFTEDTSACFICFEDANSDEELQFFCLLPCRHSTICSSCIRKIRECPKCRTPIAAVFDINSPAAISTNSQNSLKTGEIDPSLRHLYDHEDDNAGQSGNRRGFFASIKSMFGL